MKLSNVLYLFPALSVAAAVGPCPQQTISIEEESRSVTTREAQTVLIGASQSAFAFQIGMNYAYYENNYYNTGRVLIHMLELATRIFKNGDLSVTKRKPEAQDDQELLWDNTNSLTSNLQRALYAASLHVPYFYNVGQQDFMISNLTELKTHTMIFYKNYAKTLPDWQDPMNAILEDLPHSFDHTIGAYLNYDPSRGSDAKHHSSGEKPAVTFHDL